MIHDQTKVRDGGRLFGHRGQQSAVADAFEEPGQPVYRRPRYARGAEQVLKLARGHRAGALDILFHEKRGAHARVATDDGVPGILAGEQFIAGAFRL